MHDQESNTLCLKAAESKMVPFKDAINNDYHVLKEDKVSFIMSSFLSNL